ncbi:MAG: LuxR C-terminal-related transcriptional regulator [Firmicutes bacterium]|nr:LuxR C-terminal-related transcriptional regulator [Bacillota bacterium]
MQIPAYLTPPMIPRQEVQQILDMITQGYREGMANWKVKLSTVDTSAEEKQAAQELVQLLLRNIDLVSTHYDEYLQKFNDWVARSRRVLDPRRIIIILGVFEEMVMGVLSQHPTGPDLYTRYRWLHSLVMALVYSVYYHNHEECTSPSSAAVPGTADISNAPDSLLPTVLRFDELLLTTRTLEELLSQSVHFIAEHAAFRRGALFWYSAVTRTVEGICSHRIDPAEIRKVRALDSNIPGITWAIRENRPIYLSDAQIYFPAHYVKQFRLTSLLVCTLFGENKQPVGFLLLDQDGDPYQPDSEQIRLVDILVHRLSLTLRVKLYEGPPLASEPTSSEWLTQREQEILQMIAYGYSTKHIGEVLHISEHTAAEYAQTALRKLNAKNRPEAVAKGLRLGIIQ